MKCHAHGAHGAASLPAAGKTGIIAAGIHSGKTLLTTASKHPLVLFGLGLAVGVYIHKNRSQILSKADQTTD